MEYFELFKLPKEIVEEIFRKLKLIDSIKSEHLTISKNWSTILWKVQPELSLQSKYHKLDRIYNLIHPANIKRLTAPAAKIIEFAEQIPTFYNLKWIMIDRPDSNVINLITKLTSLHNLIFNNGSSLTKHDLESISFNLTRLTSINIFGISNVKDWPTISNLDRLRFASFPKNAFVPEFYERLQYLTNLVHLNAGFNQIGKIGMDFICQLTQLEQISLMKFPHQADPATAWLHISNLTNLISFNCHIPIDAAQLVSKMEKLTTLHIHPEEYGASFDMNIYSTLTALKELDCGMSFKKFPTTWTNLLSIHANHALIDDTMNFDTLTRLKSLFASFEPNAYQNLSKLTNLENLRFENINVQKTYQDLHVVSKCQNLVFLDVTADKTCAELIANLSNLTSLHLRCLPGQSWPEEDILRLTALQKLQAVILTMDSKPDGIELVLLTHTEQK